MAIGILQGAAVDTDLQNKSISRTALCAVEEQLDNTSQCRRKVLLLHIPP